MGTSRQKLRFLVVDDEKTAAVLLTGLLLEFGVVQFVHDNESAKRLALEAIDSGDPYATIFLDANMKDESGIDVLKEIREVEQAKGLAPKRGATPVVLVTASADPKVFMRAFREQADKYIRKPVNRTMIVDVLEELEVRGKKAA